MRSARVIVPLLLIGCVGLTPAASVVERGLAGLYELDRLTIVYPTRSADEATAAQRSAEVRARFLRDVHGIDVQVVADRDATGPYLASNLLLLGWNNALLGQARTPAPFTRTPDRLVLQGGLAFDGDVELGFVYASPFNPERKLFFWSRIDPETDRFQLLPFEGSQWAVFRRFLPLAQGMWSESDTWPPRRDRDAEQDHRPVLSAADAELGVVKNGSYDIVHDPNDIDSETVGRIAAARNAALRQAAGMLGIDIPEDFRVRLRVFPDGDAMVRATGITSAVHSFPRTSELYMLTRYALTPNPHEEIHLLAPHRYGACHSTALFEGLAIALEDEWGRRPLAFHAARLLDTGALPEVADVLAEGAIRAMPDGIALPSSGLLVQWLRERLDDDGFKALYRSEWPDDVAAASALSVPVDRIDAEFQGWTKKASRSAQDDLEIAKLSEQARERLIESDYAGVAALLERVLAIRPGEPQTLFNLASAQMRTGEYDNAEKHLRTVLDSDLPVDDPLIVFGHYQLGRLYDLRGQRDRALAEYRRVLELPDVRDSHRSAREAIEVPFTPERLE